MQALGREEAVRALGGQSAQEDQPVDQRKTRTNIHGNIVEENGKFFSPLLGEQLRGHLDGHGQGFQVLQRAGAVAGNGLTADGEFQNLFDTAFIVTAGEGGFVGGFSREGDVEGHGFHGIVKAGKQGDGDDGAAQLVESHAII